jgi:hypothetical protein
MAARLRYLEPTQVPERLSGAGDRHANSIVDALT